MKKDVTVTTEKNSGADYFCKSRTCVSYRKEYFQYMDITDPNNDIEKNVDYTKFISEKSLLDLKPYYFFFYDYENQKKDSNKKKHHVR